MTKQESTTAKRAAGNTTRRAVLAGVGALGLSICGSASNRAVTGTPTDNDQTSPDEHLFTDPDALVAYVDDVMADRIGDEIPGASVAIVVGDEPVFTGGYGYADVDTEVPVSADTTVFQVGSVGKLATWTAVMQGVERGVLALDEDVNRYLHDSTVEIPDTYEDPVTLRHLGTHTPGFESAIDPVLVTDESDIDSLETVLSEHQRPRIRPPGEVVGYSNYGAALAGYVVAEVHDATFEEYVQSAVFEPLDMTHSTFTQPVPDDHPGHVATGHSSNGASFTTDEDVYINMRPAGSMWATAADMAAFMSAHLGDGAIGDRRILDEATTEMMRRRHHVRHPAVTNWRYGFHEYGHPGADLISHSGGTDNFTSRLVLAPKDGVGIFVNYNVKDAAEPPSIVVDELLDGFNLRPSPEIPSPTTDPGGQERADTVAGEYSLTSLPESGPLRVADVLSRVTVDAATDGRITTETLESGSRQWIETDPYVYHEDGGYDVLAFDVDDGSVSAMHVSSEPTGEFRPVPTHERQLVTGAVFGSALSGFGLSLAGWSGHRAWRRWHRHGTGRDIATEGSE